MNTLVKLDTAGASPQFQPHTITRTSTGRYWVVYKSGTNLCAAYSDNSGWSWVEEIVQVGISPLFFAIAVDANDTVHIVYNAGSVGVFNKAQHIARNGSWGSPTIFYTGVNTTTYILSIDLVVDSSSDLHVVFIYYPVAYAYGYYIKRTSGVWGSAVIFASQGDYDSIYTPVVAVDSVGTVHTLWTSGGSWGITRRLQYRQCTVAGGWQTAVFVTANTTYQRFPSIAIDLPLNNVHIAWAELVIGASNVYNIYYCKRTTLGGWGTPEAVTSVTAATVHQGSTALGVSTGVTIAINTTGSVDVVWGGLGWGANPTKVSIQYRQRTTSWQTQQELMNEPYDQKPYALLWAKYPYLYLNGYAFVFESGKAVGSDLRFYSTAAAFPISEAVRVTSITHRYNRGIYNMELGLGDVIAPMNWQPTYFPWKPGKGLPLDEEIARILGAGGSWGGRPGTMKIACSICGELVRLADMFEHLVKNHPIP